MSRTYKVIPLADNGEAAIETMFARLVCASAVPRQAWPFVSTNIEMGASDQTVTIPADEIVALSFDRKRWWRLPPRSGESDDPGALDGVKSPMALLDGYLLGEESAQFCEYRFEELGLAIGPEKRNAWSDRVTDDYGCMARPDGTDDYGADEAGGWTDDPGEAAPPDRDDNSGASDG